MSDLTVADIVKVMGDLAPRKYAAEWDNVGLELGNPHNKVAHLLVALEVTDEVVDAAVGYGTDMIIMHHPLLFKAAETLRTDRPLGRKIAALVRQDIAVYAAHTNFDVVDMGPSATLAQKLDLQEIKPLKPASDLFKICCFVPQNSLEKVRDAISEAGAGNIGDYSHCTFSVSGKGTFLPHEGSNPTLGEVGYLSEVDEYKLETICPGAAVSQVIEDLYEHHPYEEPAYDIYPLSNENSQRGMGRIGELKEALSLEELACKVAEICGRREVRMAAAESEPVKRVAVCGGAGSDFYKQSLKFGADVFITGDLTHHTLCEILDCGLAVIDAGHRATEQPAMMRLCNYLQDNLDCRVDYLPLPPTVWSTASAVKD